MARISIRIFVDDAEHDRIDEELPPDAVAGLVEACKQAMEESKPPSPDEEKAEQGFLQEALSRWSQGRGNRLEEWTRAEEAAAEQLLRERGWRVEKPD